MCVRAGRFGHSWLRLTAAEPSPRGETGEMERQAVDGRGMTRNFNDASPLRHYIGVLRRNLWIILLTAAL